MKIKTSNITPGTLVWKRRQSGRIIKTYSGRVVDIKTAKGVVKRAIAKLAPLFPDEHNPEDSNRCEDIPAKRSKGDSY